VKTTAHTQPQQLHQSKEAWGEAGRLYFSPIYVSGPSIPAIQRLQLAVGSVTPVLDQSMSSRWSCMAGH